MQTLPVPLGGVTVVILADTGQCGVSRMDGPRNGCLALSAPESIVKKCKVPLKRNTKISELHSVLSHPGFSPNKAFCFNVCCVAVAITFKRIGFYWLRHFQ